jgi:hypothetical protein
VNSRSSAIKSSSVSTSAESCDSPESFFYRPDRRFLVSELDLHVDRPDECRRRIHCRTGRQVDQTSVSKLTWAVRQGSAIPYKVSGRV